MSRTGSRPATSPARMSTFSATDTPRGGCLRNTDQAMPIAGRYQHSGMYVAPSRQFEIAPFGPVSGRTGQRRRDIIEQRPLAERLRQISYDARRQSGIAVRLGRTTRDQDCRYLTPIRQQTLVQL